MKLIKAWIGYEESVVSETELIRIIETIRTVEVEVIKE